MKKGKRGKEEKGKRESTIDNSLVGRQTPSDALIFNGLGAPLEPESLVGVGCSVGPLVSGCCGCLSLSSNVVQ